MWVHLLIMLQNKAFKHLLQWLTWISVVFDFTHSWFLPICSSNCGKIQPPHTNESRYDFVFVLWSLCTIILSCTQQCNGWHVKEKNKISRTWNTYTFVCQAQLVGLLLVLDGQPQRVEWRSVHPRFKHSPVWVSFVSVTPHWWLLTPCVASVCPHHSTGTSSW